MRRCGSRTWSLLLAVLRPLDTAQVASLVRLCAAHRVPVVPQGGRTGLVLGSVPDASGTAVVLSLRRLRRIRAVDRFNRTMTVDAGCILSDIQQAAHEPPSGDEGEAHRVPEAFVDRVLADQHRIRRNRLGVA